MKIFNNRGLSIDPWSTLLLSNNHIDVHPLITMILNTKIQPMFSPPNYPYFQSIFHELPSENTVADGVKILIKIKVYCMHHTFCFPFLISM